MFESLSDRLGKIFDGLRGRGALNAADVDAAMREIRRALIEADVSLEVVRAFVEQVRERAVGAEVTRSVTPGQQVVKIVHDELVRVLGETAVPLDFKAVAPPRFARHPPPRRHGAAARAGRADRRCDPADRRH
jgi:signal recognition particle subunit SRP54